MKTSIGMTFIVSAVAGAAVWALSPVAVGYREPWDAPGYYYVVALLVAGSVAGMISPRPYWAHYLGAFIGQLGYEVLFLKVGPLFVLGAGFLLAYSLVFLAGAAVSAPFRRRLKAG
jgi:hypothetical protein